MQINGKLRGNIQIPTNAEKDAVISQAKHALADKLNDTQIIKEIYVPNKIVNFVVK
jgi:leucyl-tRNA synthetase